MYKPFYNLTDKEARLLLEQIKALDDDLDEIIPLSQEEVDKIEADFMPVDVSASLDARLKAEFNEYRASFVEADTGKTD